MVELDHPRGFVGRAAAFDDVGVDRPLRQELGAVHLGGLFGENVDELFADDLPLLLRVGDPGQFRQEPVFGFNNDEF